MENRDDPDPDCRDLETGCYMAFVGDIVSYCPWCGKDNLLRVDQPTNRFEFTCAACEKGYVLQGTLTPLSKLN